MVSFNLLSSASHYVWHRCAGEEVKAKCVPLVTVEMLSGLSQFLRLSLIPDPLRPGHLKRISTVERPALPPVFSLMQSHPQRTSALTRPACFSSFARVSLPVVCFSQIYKSHDILHAYFHTTVCRFSCWDKKTKQTRINRPIVV